MMDCIHINDIRAYGYIGCLPEEQTLGQWFIVNLVLSMDLAPAGESDRLANTLDYSVLIEAVQQLVKTSRCHLLERLATEIAQFLLKDDRLTQVRVHVTKVNAPIPEFGGTVAIEITRSRT